MRIAFTKTAVPVSGTLVVGVLAGGKLTDTAKAVDEKTGGALKRAIRAYSRFNGETGQMLDVVSPRGTRLSRVVLAGLGRAKEIDARSMEDLGGSVARRVGAAGDRAAAIAIDEIAGAAIYATHAAARVALGARLGAYRFDRYRTKERPGRKPSLRSVAVLAASPQAARRLFADLSPLADGILLARDLVSEPGNVIYPRTLADRARTLKDVGVKVEVLGRAQLEKLGMRTLLGVAQGSAHDPYVVVMRWNGAAESRKPPVAFVGKGVTFDSGGLSLKTSQGMEDMKFDMAGSAAVIGVMRALAGRKASVNAVGVIGLVENMPSATAQRPGDVVTSMSGQTIEILNTDAEGRLVLADCLWYTREHFKPRAMFDLATLTGAIIVSLGFHHAGIFSNDDALAEQLTAAGIAEGEKVWRLPLGKAYDKQINSEIADMKNIGGKGAGSITAAQFLKRFVGNTPWVHIDIAGTAWNYKDKPTVPKGASGFGIRLLNRLVADHFDGT